jgi:hypothetical protein
LTLVLEQFSASHAETHSDLILELKFTFLKSKVRPAGVAGTALHPKHSLPDYLMSDSMKNAKDYF